MERVEDQSLRGRVIVVGMFIIFTLVLMISFYTEYEDRPFQRVNNSANNNIFSQTQGQNTSLEEVTEDPNAFLGRSISVRGIVQENIGTRGLTINTNNSEGEKLLIVSKKTLVGVGGGPGVSQYGEREGIRVSGVVSTFRLSELEAELGTDLNDEMYKAYEGKPVLIADTIDSLQSL